MDNARASREGTQRAVLVLHQKTVRLRTDPTIRNPPEHLHFLTPQRPEYDEVTSLTATNIILETASKNSGEKEISFEKTWS